MMRSLFAGVSGLRNHQTRMDVIGNNIANVNTIGFKSSRVNFQEVFSQTLRGASSPRAHVGGTNPQQVGLGMTLATIDTLMTDGNLQYTGKMTDMAIDGNGFFILGSSGQLTYTRAGNFGTDAVGYLVNPANGLRVQGWMANPDGTFGVKDEGTLADVRIPVGETISAQPTSRVAYAQNLDSRAAVGFARTTSVQVYDSQGKAFSVQITFTKTADNNWSWAASTTTAGGTVTGDAALTFGASGNITAGAAGSFTLDSTTAGLTTINLDLSSITQYAADNTIQASERNGYPMGALDTFTIDPTGTVTGVYTNGLTKAIAQVALASFSNPAGLLKGGESSFLESNNSGLRQIGEAGTGGRGDIAPSNLEMSNVDLSSEFTNMIITQRGFQANSRTITSSDEMLQELVNLKR